MLLRLSDEGPEFFNFEECLAVHLLARERVEALLKAVQRIGLRARLLHEVAHLAVQLHLEDARVHKQLHAVRFQ